MGILDWFNEEEKEEKLTPIATNSWINVYYRILYKPNEKWKKNKIEKHINQELNNLISIVTNIGQVIVNGKLIGFLNPALNKNSLITYEKIAKNFMAYHFSRNFTFKVIKSKEYKGWYEYLIKSKEKSDNGIKEGIREIKKGEKVVYGYSPIDFAQDKFMLFELDKEISEYLNILFTEGEDKAYTDFNKNGEPIVKVKISTLFFEHKVKDRLELKQKNPEIEKICFGDSFDDFIEHFRKQKEEKNVVKWLKEVDKLIKEYE